MGAHINDKGEFQSDMYPEWHTPARFLMLKLSDPLAQDLLWMYAERREETDAEFSEDLRTCLLESEFAAPADDAPIMVAQLWPIEGLS